MFDLPSQVDTRSSAIELDLGVVKNLARVRLNGVDLGVVWCAPWRLEQNYYVDQKVVRRGAIDDGVLRFT